MNSPNKPQLVLDIAGVLISNLSPLFWEELALRADVSYSALKARFKQVVRQELWTGRMPEAEFWVWLLQQCPSIDIVEVKSLLFKNITPLPAVKMLPTWSQIADIHLLSNHRLSWLTTFIHSVQPFVKSITIEGARN